MNLRLTLCIFDSGYRVVGVNPLPVEEALTNGVAIASEFIVFCVAGTILVVEYKMSERSSSAKAAAAKKEKDEAQQELDDRFETLDTKILVLAERLQSLEKAIAAQEQRHTKVCSLYMKNSLCSCELKIYRRHLTRSAVVWTCIQLI